MSSLDYKKRVLSDEDLTLIAGGVRALADLPGACSWNRDRLWRPFLTST